jgi:hypothetical protein
LACEQHPTDENQSQYARLLDQNQKSYLAYRIQSNLPFEPEDYREHERLARFALRAALTSREPEITKEIRNTLFKSAREHLQNAIRPFKSDPKKWGTNVLGFLIDLLKDHDFAPVRLGFPIAGFPKEEMAAWARLWTDIRQLRDQRAQ